jgi:hypothetical protein
LSYFPFKKFDYICTKVKNKKVMAKMNYDAINFKNKDVDKFSTKFGNGDPIKAMQGPAEKAVSMTKKEAVDFDKKRKKQEYNASLIGMASKTRRDIEKGYKDFQAEGNKLIEGVGNQVIETAKYLKSPSTYERPKNKK